MAHPMMSRKKIAVFSIVLFFAGLVFLTVFGGWWPGIMLAVGLPLSLRQYLLGRRYDMCVSLFVFLGVFITVQFDIAWEIILPVIFTIGGVYLLGRELIEFRQITEDESEEDTNLEIEDEEKKNQK